MTNDSRRDDGPGMIPPHGGCRKLKSYQVAEIVYDFTAAFCDRYIDRRSRMHDQMVQAGYLLDLQLCALERGFLEDGGYGERLYRTRSERGKRG